MAELINVTRNLKLATHVHLATTFFSRHFSFFVLKSVPQNEAIWVNHRNKVHSWFMKSSMDIIFVNESMSVVKVDVILPDQSDVEKSRTQLNF